MRRFGISARTGSMLALVALIAAAPPAQASDSAWVAMDGAAIKAALTGQVVDYAGDTWQDFRASGRTLYHAGRPSWGYWAVRDDRYCSSWPPSDLWACYRMERQGADAIRWIGASGDITSATIRGPLE